MPRLDWSSGNHFLNLTSLAGIPKKFYTCFPYILAYLKDSNAAAHSVDSDIFQSSDSSICALQDLTLTFIS